MKDDQDYSWSEILKVYDRKKGRGTRSSDQGTVYKCGRDSRMFRVLSLNGPMISVNLQSRVIRISRSSVRYLISLYSEEEAADLNHDCSGEAS